MATDEIRSPLASRRRQLQAPALIDDEPRDVPGVTVPIVLYPLGWGEWEVAGVALVEDA